MAIVDHYTRTGAKISRFATHSQTTKTNETLPLIVHYWLIYRKNHFGTSENPAEGDSRFGLQKERTNDLRQIVRKSYQVTKQINHYENMKYEMQQLKAKKVNQVRLKNIWTNMLKA